MRRRKLLIGGAAATLGAAAGLKWLGTSDGPGGSQRADAAPPRAAAPSTPKPRRTGLPNVLMISIDDMKPWIGAHGFTDAHTPALDELAKRAVVFRRAYCAAPACSPSRAVVWTGMAPHQTGCYLNKHNWRSMAPRPVTLPRLLRQAGYFTAGFGKLFHTQSHDDPGAWTQRVHHRLLKLPNAPRNVPRSIYRRAGSRFDWAALDIPVERMDDHRQVDRAIAAMNEARQEPWFVACGIFRPHLPWYVPRRFFDLHPLESVELPPYLPDDLDDVPPRGRKLAKKLEHRVIVEKGLWRQAVQAYMASISYVDFELGRLLAGVPQDTVIILWSDHGWHLGPKNHWHKYALWEEATQTVFAMAGPGFAAGKQCGRTVSLTDVYPTMCELTGIAPPHELFGRSVLPLAKNPSARWDRPALTTYGPGNHSVRSERYRYIRYDDGSEELYDHDEDPNEWTNLAHEPGAASVIARHAALLPAEGAPMLPAREPRKPKFYELPDRRRMLVPAE